LRAAPVPEAAKIIGEETIAAARAAGGGGGGPAVGHEVVAGELAEDLAKFIEVRPIHWSPYDRVGVVNADP
jgi:hypothetical protein